MTKQKVNWRNNPEGFSAPVLPLGPNGKWRSHFTESDIEIVLENPITLVAIDAFSKRFIEYEQALRVGYKPPPLCPLGLDPMALLNLFLEAARRIRGGELTVPEELKKKYAYVYEIDIDDVDKD